MKRIFFTMMLAALLAMSGCAGLSGKDFDRLGGRVGVTDVWGTSTAGAFSGVTLEVGNPTAHFVEVEAVCHFEDGQLFGSSGKVGIRAMDKVNVLVRGMAQCMPEVCARERVVCQITEL